MILYYQDTYIDGESIEIIDSDQFCNALILKDRWLRFNIEIIYVGY